MKKTPIFVALSAIGCFFIALQLNCGAAPKLQGSEVDPQKTTSSSSGPEASESQTPSLTKREISVIGSTRLKTPIKAFIFGSGERHVVVLGGIHGDEPSSRDVAEAFASSLEHSSVPTDMTVIVVPAANPDGIASGTRTNSSRVDINRNFPARSWRAESRGDRYAPGKKPASELETQAILSLIGKYTPVLLISIHAPLDCINWDGPAEDVASAMSQSSGFPLKQDIGYETPGSLGSYAGKGKSIPTITLELQSAVKSESVTRDGLLALRAAIAQLQRPSQ